MVVVFVFLFFFLRALQLSSLDFSKNLIPHAKKKMCALEHLTQVSVIDVVLVSNSFFMKSVLLVQLASF